MRKLLFVFLLVLPLSIGNVNNGQSNPLAQWSGSIHATAGNAIANAPMLGSYSTVAQNACLSCHMPHNSAAGPRFWLTKLFSR